MIIQVMLIRVGVTYWWAGAKTDEWIFTTNQLKITMHLYLLYMGPHNVLCLLFRALYGFEYTI